MQQNNTPVFVTIIVVVLAFAGALFFAFDRISSLSNDLKGLEGKVAIFSNPPIPAAPTPPPLTGGTPPPPAGGEPPAPTGASGTSTPVTIPSAIIFQTSSSEALAPQSRLTVTIESAKRDVDGRLTLGIKVFNGEAAGPAALDPKALIEILNFEGENVKANGMSGAFAAIPAKGAVSGSLTFQTDPARRTVIIQINLPEPRFYEFDFDHKTYKQAEVG